MQITAKKLLDKYTGVEGNEDEGGWISNWNMEYSKIISDPKCISTIIDEEGRSILFNACFMDASYEEVKFLLENESNPNCMSEKTKRNVLHVACVYSSSVDVIKLLIEKDGMDLYHYSEEFGSYLHYCALNKTISASLVRIFINLGINVNFTDSCFRSVLHVHCIGGSVDIDTIISLVEARCDCDLIDINRETALMSLCMRDDRELDENCISYLMDNMKIFESKNTEEETLLDILIEKGVINQNLFQKLIDKMGRATVFIEDKTLDYPLRKIYESKCSIFFTDDFFVDNTSNLDEIRRKDFASVSDFLELICRRDRVSVALISNLLNILPLDIVEELEAFFNLCGNRFVRIEMLQEFQKKNDKCLNGEDKNGYGAFYYALNNKEMPVDCFSFLMNSDALLGNNGEKHYFSIDNISKEKLEMLCFSGKYEVAIHDNFLNKKEASSIDPEKKWLLANACAGNFKWEPENHSQFPGDVQKKISLFLMCIIKSGHSINKEKNMLYQILGSTYNFIKKKKFQKAINQHHKVLITK